MKYCILFLAFLTCSIAHGQGIGKRVLFLGNSYTGVNNLPQMLANVASSTGDTLLFDSNTPGGYTLQGHSSNASSLAKIAQGNWDFVVLQEQSQLPSFPISQVQADVFPYAQLLDSIINAQNPCAETVFYMTWGRKNGDASNCASWPPVCTYAGMDSLLNLRYRMMANDNNAIVSPVAVVWRYIIQNYPSLDLYQADQSHPSVAGTYAAACSFYTVLFRKDPTAISFNSTLSATDAANIRTATKLMVYDSLMKWHVGAYDPSANFSYIVSNGNQVAFTNNSLNANHFSWNFGDGASASDNNPIHTYLTAGTYTIKLMASKCGLSDSSFQTINISAPFSVNETSESSELSIYPNPVTNILHVKHTFSNKITYKIVSITGQQIKAGMITNSEEQIHVSSLSEGIYFLQFYDNHKLLGQHKFVNLAK